MAVKTFTTGEVLTAADTNTYLNNGGLVYVKSQTIGSGVSTVTVSDAFSSTYDNYRIVINDGVASTNVLLRLQIGSINTGYYGGFFGTNYSTSAFVGQNDNNATLFNYVGSGGASYLAAFVDVQNPFLTKRKYISATHVYLNASNGYGAYVGETTGTTSSTSFVISPNTGTLTGGTITVYGYRKA
jgi:hypothetical protein